MATVIPAVTRISERVIRVLGCNPGSMTLQGTNTYIVGTERCRILIDTGEADTPQYINHLKSVLRHDYIDITHILLTHWHHDHIGGLTDVLAIDERIARARVWKYPTREYRPLNTNVFIQNLKNNQEFKVDGATIKVIHTPGHTTDHVVLYLVEENAIFSGDCILGEGTAVFEDLHDYMKSLNKILDMQPSIIYPGHGNIVNNPIERINYYISHRIEREMQILDILNSRPDDLFTEEELVKIIYTDVPQKLFNACEVNVNHHLKKLMQEMKVELKDGRWRTF